MFRTITWFLYFGLSTFFTFPYLIYAKYLDSSGRYNERDKLADRVARRWADHLVRLCGARVKVSGEDNIPKDRAVVFIGNHQGNFDIPLLLAYVGIPKGFISKIEIERMPFISTWMRYLHCVFMDRSDIRKSVTAINEGIEKLKNGHSLVIFPEGTRSRGNAVGEFKQGSFKLATKAEVPIVPITMKNTYKLYEGNKGKFKPADVEIIISPPVETRGLSPEDTKKLPDKIKEIILSNLS